MVLSRHKPLQILVGVDDETLDKEGRVITLIFKDRVITGSYIPNSGKPNELLDMQKKLRFFSALQNRANQFLKSDTPWIWGGDTNVAIFICDRYDGAHSDINASNPSCTTIERETLHTFVKTFQLTDLILKYNKKPPFTWFFNRYDMVSNKGMRIDHIFSNTNASPIVKYATTLPDTYGSDHRPNIVLLKGAHSDTLAQQFALPCFLKDKPPKEIKQLLSSQSSDRTHLLVNETEIMINEIKDLLKDQNQPNQTVDTPISTDTILETLLDPQLHSIDDSVTNIFLKHRNSKQQMEECICSEEPVEIVSVKITGLEQNDNTVYLPKLKTILSTNSNYQYKSKLDILVDTGASRNMISKSTLVNLFKTWENAQTHISKDNRLFRSANNQINASLGSITLNLKFNNRPYENTFSIMENMPIDAILGNPFLMKHNAIINYKTKKIHLQNQSINKKRSPIQFELSATSLDVIQNPIITLHATDTFTLKPMHEVRVWGDAPFDHPFTNTDIVFGSVSTHTPANNTSQYLHNNKIATATGITFLQNGRTMLKIGNLTNSEIKITKGDIIGEFMEDNESLYDKFYLDNTIDKKMGIGKREQEKEITPKGSCNTTHLITTTQLINTLHEQLQPTL